MNCQVFAAASEFPSRSLAAVETFAVYWSSTRSPVGLEEQHPGAVPAEVAAHRRPVAGSLQREGALAEALSIDLSKATTIVAFGCASVAPSAGRTKLITGGFDVVNCQVFAAASEFPSRSLAAVETFAVYCVPGARSPVGLEEQHPGAVPAELPLTGAPSLVRFSEKAPLAEALSIDLSKATRSFAFGCVVGGALGRARRS